MNVDPKGTVEARPDISEGGLTGQDLASPGEMIPLTTLQDGRRVHLGYKAACPGCGEWLQLRTGPREQWQEVGSLTRPGTLTLIGPIVHGNGCGWSGHLDRGVFLPD